MQPADPHDSRLETPGPSDGSGMVDASVFSGADDHFGLGRGSGDRPWADEELHPGTNLGGVVIVRLLAEGGMGRVYEGRQEAPARTVAVKVMRDGVLAASLVRRFEYEAEILARLRHPNIAQIHMFGTHAGRHGIVPYFVMELVEGAKPITTYANEERLPLRERVALLRRVCAAVAHGHRKGVIHRDLKPGNIVVDAAGEPKVIDYGVARSIDAECAGMTGVTRAGDVVGTLRYMSPEQLGVEEEGVDARTDVYALGLVLHELVTGALPYEIRGTSVVEAVRVLGDAAATPTTAVERAARAAGRINAAEARGLATLTGACLAKRPAERYSTAVELEAELGRWLDGEPILAKPPTMLESAARFARRHRAATLAAAGVLVSLLAAVAGITVFYLRAEQQRHLAEAARLMAERREADAERQAASARSQLYISNVLLAAEARDRDNVAEARRLLASARELVGDAGTARPVELDCLAASLDESLLTFGGNTGMITSVAWSRDGRRVATGATDGTIRLRSADGTDADERILTGHADAVWSLSFSPDGGTVASGAADGDVRLWDAGAGKLLRVLDGHDGAVYAVTFSPDGGTLVTGSRDRTARAWDTATWTERLRFEGHTGTVYSACFSPDGREVVTGSLDRTARVWDAATGAPRCALEGHEGRVFAVAFAADGAAIATAGDDATARVWDPATGRQQGVLRHPFRVNSIAFVGAGARLATASGDGVLRVWSTSEATEVARLRGHAAAVWSVAVAPGSGTVATGSADGTARIWDVDFTVSPSMPCGDKVLSVACSPDGGLVAAGMADSVVRLWDAATLLPRGVLRGAVGRVSAVEFLDDGRRIAGGCDDGVVRIWSTASRERPAVSFKPHERRIFSIDVSPDGRLLATAAEDRTVRLWNLEQGGPVGEPLKHPRRAYAAVFSPDGTRLATACEDRVARLWSVADGIELLRLTGHEGPVNWVTYSPDGRLLATACSDGAVRLWHVADGSLRNVLTGPARQVWKVAFSPDGERIAAVSADATVQIWDVDSGRAAPVLRGHRDQAWGVAFAADGRSLFTGSWDGTARVWGVPVAEIAARRRAAGR